MHRMRNLYKGLSDGVRSDNRQAGASLLCPLCELPGLHSRLSAKGDTICRTDREKSGCPLPESPRQPAGIYGGKQSEWVTV